MGWQCIREKIREMDKAAAIGAGFDRSVFIGMDGAELYELVRMLDPPLGFGDRVAPPDVDDSVKLRVIALLDVRTLNSKKKKRNYYSTSRIFDSHHSSFSNPASFCRRRVVVSSKILTMIN